MQNTAPNALHDSKYRFDPPKCDEDTRVEVIEELMGWIQDRESPQRLLCMTGAAGSGKSALQQTVAEECSGLDILASTFFFSSTDPTRNTVSAVIPTIAYQLGSNNPALREAISATITKDPLIFEKSLKTQMKKLIVSPIEDFSRDVSKPELAILPYAILIDGLDECTDEQRQAELLATIDDCLLQNGALPFRVFISSRPEWAIRSALEDTGHLHQRAYHIQLSDQYDASGDIRRALWRKLRDIGRRSCDPRARSLSWPSNEDIETLVANASGQFIYAATVIKFVSERRSSPVDRLRTVLTWTPKDRAQPFAALDLLYTSIVSAAKEAYEAAHPDRDFLLLFSEITGLEDNAHRGLISDLRSLVTIDLVLFPELGDPEGFREVLFVYHKSFPDFLDTESRSKSFFIPETRAVELVIVTCIRALDIDRDDRMSSPLIRDIVYRLLLKGFSKRQSEFGRIPHLLSLGSNFEKIKRWEKVDKLIEEGYGGKRNPPLVDQVAIEGWLALLSHVLLELENHGQDFQRVIQALHDKWQQFYDEIWSTQQNNLGDGSADS
ncbi:hypothetical protein H1R20_g14785, partial [Candolleomyces eurysporus]